MPSNSLNHLSYQQCMHRHKSTPKSDLICISRTHSIHTIYIYTRIRTFTKYIVSRKRNKTITKLFCRYTWTQHYTKPQPKPNNLRSFIHPRTHFVHMIAGVRPPVSSNPIKSMNIANYNESLHSNLL